MKTKTECRVCLKDGGSIPIFGDDDKPDISMEVTIFGSIQLSKDDEFPKALCKTCFKLLENAISFRKAALHADVLLQRRKQKGLSTQCSSTIKLETDDDNKTKILKPDFLVVDTTENVPEIKIEFLTDDILLDDGGIDYDVDESKKDLIDCNKKEGNVINCECCNQNFTSPEEFGWHRTSITHLSNTISSSVKIKKLPKIKIERGPKYVKDQKCNECNKFFTQNQYIKHMKVKHNFKEEHTTKTKECPVCNKLFRPDYLARHKRAVHGIDVQKPDPAKVSIECPVCKKMLVRRYFNTHMKIHDETQNKKFICDQCGKTFTFQSAFINHRAIHNNDLPYQCDYCPYRGRSKHLLRIHTRTHTGDYPYKCTLCSTRCITKSNLNRHMLRHKGPVDFVCDSCNRSFYSKLELERHITVIHLGIKSHICNICGVAFGYRQGLMKHLRKVHKRAKGLGRAKATYLKIQEEEMLKQQAGGLN